MHECVVDIEEGSRGQIGRWGRWCAWLAQVEHCRTGTGLACELLIIGVCTRGRLDDVGVGHEFSLSHGAAILA